MSNKELVESGSNKVWEGELIRPGEISSSQYKVVTISDSEWEESNRRAIDSIRTMAANMARRIRNGRWKNDR